MKISSICLNVVLAAASAGIVHVNAFNPSNTSPLRANQVRVVNPEGAQEARVFPTGGMELYLRIHQQQRSRGTRSGPFQFMLEAAKGDNEGGDKKEEKTVEEVMGEAEEAIRAADKALEEVNKKKEDNNDDGTLIDADAIANEKKEDLQDTLQKLAKGEIAAKDVTQSLEETKKSIEAEKKEAAEREEKERREAAEREEKERREAAEIAEMQRLRVIEMENKKKQAALQKEALFAGVGGASIGAIAGTALDIYFAISNVIEIEPAVPPLVLSFALGAAGFGAGLQENAVGDAARNILGGGVKSTTASVTSSVSSAVESTVEEVKATPGKIKVAVDEKVKETTEELKAIPIKVKDAAVDTAEKTAAEIKQIPDKVKDAAVDAAKKTEKEIEAAATKAAEEIKATPGRVAESTKQAVVKTVTEVEEKIEKAVDDVVAIPKKTLDEISSTVKNIIPIEEEVKKPPMPPAETKPPKPPVPPKSAKKSPPIVPKPPKMPPPPSLLKELEKEKVAKPITPKVPKVSLPKLDIKPPPLPTPPKVKQEKSKPKPPPKKKEDDGFVFSEVSLKQFTSGLGKDQESESADDGINARAQAKKKKEQAATAAKKKKEEEIARKKIEAERKEEERQKALALKAEQAAKKKEEAEVRELERKEAQLQAAIRKKQQAEERLAAKEEREYQAQEKKRIADERRAEQEAAAEARRIAAEERKREMEEKRQATIAAAQAKKAEMEAKRKALLQGKQAESSLSGMKRGATLNLAALSQKKDQQKKQASQAVSKAKPGATISLGFFGGFGGQKDDDSSASVAAGEVPTLSQWVQNKDGSVTGFISGSKSFRNGESITTSTLKTKSLAANSEVTTVSGSKYFLKAQKKVAVAKAPAVAPKKSPVVTPKATGPTAAQKALAQKEAAAAKAKQLAEERKAAAAAKRAEVEAARIARLEAAAKRKADAEAAVAAKRAEVEAAKIARQEAAEAKRAEAAAATRARQEAAAAAKSAQAKKAEAAIAEAPSRSTISLGFLNFGGDSEDTSSQSSRPASKTVSQAPRGVPTISKWKQNRDGSISGVISGSNFFGIGETITTSPITSEPADGAVVQTLSGSKYFLAPKGISPVKQAQKAEEAIAKAKPGATVSLGFFNFGQDSDDSDSKTKAVPQKPSPKIVSQAPRGVPVLSKWRQNRDGSVTGFIYGSPAFGEGESITTSPITSDAVDSAVVQTKSGSRYYLEPKPAGGGFFGLNKPQAPTASSSVTDKRAEAAAAKKAKDEAAAAKRAEAKAARKAAQEAAVAKKAEAEAARKARIDAQNKARQDAAAAAKAKKDALAAQRAKKSEQAIADAPPRSTISLGFLDFGGGGSAPSPSPKGSPAKATPKTLARAPRGVPIITRWRQNRDGSISGVISGSNAYSDGESVTTSPITSDAADGALVQTSSGSKYFLAPKGTPAPKRSAPVKKAPAPAPPARKSFSLLSQKPDIKAKPKASAPKTESKPLFGFGRGKKVDPTPAKRAPPGVPRLVKWRKNRDSSVTGFISGSPAFPEGDRITTSPITTGTIESGEVVKTGSGSRYYLV